MTLARELADTAGRPQVDKNLLINGGMNIFQRSTARSSRTTSGYYTADRFRNTLSSMGTWTYSRSTDVPSAQGFGYSLKLDCTTADASPAASDFHSLQHRIEGQNLQHLLKGTSSAKALTLSFWVKSNKTGTYIVTLYDTDNTRNISKAYTISSASTWEKKEITFAGDTTGTLDNDNANSLQLEFFFGAGTDYSSGTLQTSWGAYSQADRAVGQVNLADSTSNELYITGIQLEIGEAATDFQFEPYEKILIKCQRYYIRYQGDASDDRFVAMALLNDNHTARAGITFPTTMRDIPTVGENHIEILRGNSGITDVSYEALVDPAINGCFLQVAADSGTPFTVGQTAALRLDNATDSYVEVIAEL
tara:strand:- start:188 stop:1276 length:1089 start_codon:yes stop_codon:yes gene_type:complete